MSGVVTKRDLLKRLVGRGRKPAQRAVPAAFPVIPFSLESCTLIEPPTPDEQEAFTRHIQTFKTRAACWEHAPYADWMLDVLRSEFHHVGIAPERELRRFALDLLNGVKGVDAEGLANVITAVERRIAGEASLDELAAVQTQMQPVVAPGAAGPGGPAAPDPPAAVPGNLVHDRAELRRAHVRDTR